MTASRPFAFVLPNQSPGANMELIGHITEFELPVGLILFVAGVIVGFAAAILIRRRA
jgi:hypothetical protein